MRIRSRPLALGILVTGILSAGAAHPQGHLEGRRARAVVIYMGSVGEVRKVGPLEGIAPGITSSRMEATIRVAQVLRAPAGVAPPAETVVRFDTIQPVPDGGGGLFYRLAAKDHVLVFTASFDKGYPTEIVHGAAGVLAETLRQRKELLAAADAETLRLHGLDEATRLSQIALYDRAIATLPSPPPPPRRGRSPSRP